MTQSISSLPGLNPAAFLVFDNGGMTPDRYSVLPFWQDKGRQRGSLLALSSRPDAPEGISEWVQLPAKAIENGLELGARISWEDLPQGVQRHASVRIAAECELEAQTAPPTLRR